MTMKFLILSVILGLTRANHSVPHPNDLTRSRRSIGGADITINSAPWQVSIQHLSKHHCGGSIITKDWVITSAKCVLGIEDAIVVRAGVTYYNTGGSLHVVNKVIKHESFHVNTYGFSIDNIALIHINEPFIFDITRQAIGLFDMNEHITSTTVVVSGWGDIVSIPKSLQQYTASVISKINCNVTYSKYGGIYDNQSCFGELNGKKAACPTDAGGPVIYSRRLAGVISWSEGCGRTNFPTIVTDVGAYRLWISRHVGI